MPAEVGLFTSLLLIGSTTGYPFCSKRPHTILPRSNKAGAPEVVQLSVKYHNTTSSLSPSSISSCEVFLNLHFLLIQTSLCLQSPINNQLPVQQLSQLCRLISPLSTGPSSIMSVPSGKYEPVVGSASSKIPIICGARVSDKAKKYLDIVSSQCCPRYAAF